MKFFNSQKYLRDFLGNCGKMYNLVFMKVKKAAPKRLKIVCQDVVQETYDRVKELAVEEKRTIGKQMEYLAELAIQKFYKNK